MGLLRRNNFKWNINELLALQREYELLGMSIQDISSKHGRTIESILFRLQQEKFIETWIDATGYQEYSKTQSIFPDSFICKSNTDSDSDYQESDDKDDKDDSDYEEESESELDDDEESENEESENEESENEEDELDDDEDYEDEDEDEEDEVVSQKNEISALDKRVWSLENTVNDVKKLIMSIVYKLNIPYNEQSEAVY